MDFYPFRFEPTFRQYIWGGRRLGETLGKPIGPDGVYAESWEVVDHGDDQSIVANGPLAGKSLRELIAADRVGMLGETAREDQFPLLMKYLDCNRVLSIQVHPNDAQAAQLHPPDRGKTEAWYVIDAEPDAVIYAGLREGVTRDDLQRAIASDQVDACLHTIDARPGMCLFIPAGTVHALGAGMLVAEIQQSSDTTYRLYDWGRVDAEGKSRPLHIKAGLAVIDFQRGPVEPQVAQPTHDGAAERLVDCDKFTLNRYMGKQQIEFGGDGRFHIVSLVQGSGSMRGNVEGETKLVRGETLLLPAAATPIAIELADDATLLEMR